MRGGLLRRRIGVGGARHAPRRAAPSRRAWPGILAAEREPLRAQAQASHAVRHVLLQRVEEAHLVDYLYPFLSFSRWNDDRADRDRFRGRLAFPTRMGFVTRPGFVRTHRSRSDGEEREREKTARTFLAILFLYASRSYRFSPHSRGAASFLPSFLLLGQTGSDLSHRPVPPLLAAACPRPVSVHASSPLRLQHRYFFFFLSRTKFREVWKKWGKVATFDPSSCRVYLEILRTDRFIYIYIRIKISTFE